MVADYSSSNSEEPARNQDHRYRNSVPRMSLLTMTAPSFRHDTFRRNCSWESESRPSPEVSTPSRLRADPEPVALPSIRQAFPELQLRISDSNRAATRATPALSITPLTTSPNTASISTVATPEYVHSPSSGYKRQRVSTSNEERGEALSQVPRLCTVPPSFDRLEPPAPFQKGRELRTSPTLAPPSSRLSASSSPPISSASSATASNSISAEGWPTSRFVLTNSGREMTADPASERLTEKGNSDVRASSASRALLPGLSQLQFEHERPASIAQTRAYRSGGYTTPTNEDNFRYPSLRAHHSEPSGHGHRGGLTPDNAGPGQQHHPSRMQSLSMGSIRGFDRAAFPSTTTTLPYHHQHQPSGYHPRDVSGGEFGSLGLAAGYGGAISGVSNGGPGDVKQRKRRGNLPKETTDKLRSWFVAHLHHPYPSEDEKQELMRQTGLQMNQISNWFINARRRQLPAMINNARVETDAMSSSRGSSVSARGMDSSRGSSGSVRGSDRHNMLAMPERMLPSPERGLVPRSTAMYDGDRVNQHGSPMSEDDYDDIPGRHHGHIKRGSV